MEAHANPLTELAPAALALITGEGRKRLVRYLDRWGHHGPLLAYLDRWLADQPGSVSLREGRARVLIDLGRGEEALGLLAALDAERPPTVTRRQLRLRALIAAGRFEEAHAAIDALAESPGQEVMAHLLRGDALRAEGRPDDGALAYEQARALDPGLAAAARRLAELAVEQGDPEAARGQIDALMLRPDYAPTVADLQILLRAAGLAGDEAAATALAAQVAAREAEERGPLLAELGLAPQPEGGAPAPAPAPAAEGALSEATHAALRELFGLSEFRPNQARVIANVLAGRSTLAVMPTGAGKSLTYQLPAMLLPEATVVVSPLIALMKDQLDGLPPAVRERATLINSTLAPAETAARLRGIAAGQYRLVYIAPERLRQRAFLHALKRCGVSLFVVDEAHCLSLWGLNFRPDYLFISRAVQELGGPPLLALTATASPETQEEIRAALGELDLISASVFRPNLYLQVLRAGGREEKERAVVEICRSVDGPVVVYARARQTCEDLAALLRAEGLAADHYHAQVAGREAAQERFMRGETRVLVATVAFGMGIDKADIRAIVHYNLPSSVEGYFQEAGRAGRDGQPARCVLLYAPTDKGRLTSWLSEEALTRDQLRAVYRAVRAQVRGRYEIVDMARVQRDAGADDETLLRVGLSVLERVGLLRRHFDQPRTAALTWREGAALPPEAAALAEAAGLIPGVTVDVDPLALAEALGGSPVDLEARLLEWHDAGLIRYRAGPRAPLLELLPPPPDVAERLGGLLDEYRERQERRVEAVAAYARAARCRHRTMAGHFGQKLATCRTVCDICAPGGGLTAPAAYRRAATAPLPPRDDDDPRGDVQRILDGLEHLPFPMGRSGLAKVLKGSSGSPIDADRCPEFGALRHLSVGAIENLIERLVEEGYLARDEQDEYRRLSLSLSGRRARRDPAYLPEWATMW